jgi:hypothetical protein
MAYDEDLAARVRERLARTRGIEEKRMFGGVVFLLDGHILVGVWKDSLIARLGPDAGEAALREPHVGAFDVTGKAMTGWVLVAAEGVAEDEPLADWIERARAFVETLPAK